jgi:cytoskeletal protein RodZ
MPQPPRQEQQPISAMDFLRGTPGQFRAHKQLPVEPEPVRTGRIPKRTRKLVWAIFGLWTLTIIGAVAYLQLTVYAGQIQRAANSAQLTPAASSGAGDATQPAQEPPALNAAIDDTAATEPPAQASPPLAGSAPSTSRPLHPSIQPALTAPVFQAFAPDDADQPPAATATELSVAPSPQVLSAATAPVAPPPPVSAVSVDGATLHAPIPPKPPPLAAPVASAPQLDLGLLLSRGNAMLALGDISAARLLYERATALGSAGAATRLGNTYDAAFLASIQARGIVADQAAAIAWYRKAAALGDTEAVHQLKRFAPAQ